MPRKKAAPSSSPPADKTLPPIPEGAIVTLRLRARVVSPRLGVRRTIVADRVADLAFWARFRVHNTDVMRAKDPELEPLEVEVLEVEKP